MFTVILTGYLIRPRKEAGGSPRLSMKSEWRGSFLLQLDCPGLSTYGVLLQRGISKGGCTVVSQLADTFCNKNYLSQINPAVPLPLFII